jgi:hypothetical protein
LYADFDHWRIVRKITIWTWPHEKTISSLEKWSLARIKWEFESTNLIFIEGTYLIELNYRVQGVVQSGLRLAALSNELTKWGKGN